MIDASTMLASFAQQFPGLEDLLNAVVASPYFFTFATFRASSGHRTVTHFSGLVGCRPVVRSTTHAQPHKRSPFKGLHLLTSP